MFSRIHIDTATIKQSAISSKSIPILGFFIRQLANIVSIFRFWLTIKLIELLFFNPKQLIWYDNPTDWWDPSTDGVKFFSYFLLAGLTDALDGIIARYFEIVSDVGKMLDKSIDKALIVPVLIFVLRLMLWAWSITLFVKIPVAMLFVITLTDSLLFVGAFFLWAFKVRVDTSREGKNKMIMECVSGCFVALFVMILGVRITNIFFLIVLTFILVPTFIYCLASAKGYARDGWNALVSKIQS